MQTNGTGHHTRHALQAVVAAMAFNLLIAASKLSVALFVTRSAALFSEGLHSAADAFNSVTLLFGIIQGKRAPDRTHPFGYGLETNFWAMMASLVLLVSAAASLWMGYQRFSQPAALENTGWAIGLLVLSVVFEIGALSAASKAVVSEVGLETPWWRLIPDAFTRMSRVQSPTTRFVFYEDLVALLGAAVALVAIIISEVSVELGWLTIQTAHWPDALASIVIGFMLLGLAINLFRYNRNFLTGAAASENVEKAIERLVLETHGISALRELRTIDQGVSGLFIHLRVEVEPDVPVRDMDDRIEHLKDRLILNMGNVKEVFVEALANETTKVWGEAFDQLLGDGIAQELLTHREATIMHNVLEFAETTTREVMVPRTDVISVEVNTAVRDVATVLLETKHSRLPVYRGHVDQLVGMVHARDVFACVLQGDDTTALESILKEIDIFPETKLASDLLEVFQRDRIQMAAVMDEHGGFAGIITVADLMEELVGELWEDEDEPEEPPEWHAVDEYTLRASGRLDIYDLNERFGWNVPDEDYKTVGGFVFGLLGREPEVNDQVRFEDLIFTVLEVEGARIHWVEIVSTRPLRLDETVAVPVTNGELSLPHSSSTYSAEG